MSNTSFVLDVAGLMNRLVAAPLEKLLLCGLLLLPLGAHCASTIDVYEFETPQQEQQFKVLIDELRCPKCLNTNLAGSDAPIARDLRREVHEQLLLGRSNDEILDHLVARYGEFVRYRPPFNARTWLIWTVPVVFLLAGLAMLLRVLFAQRRKAADLTLASDEQAAIADLLERS